MTTNDCGNSQNDPYWASLMDNYHGLRLDRTQKQEEGQNDFNLLASVLEVNDEVRLHSRFLYAMFNSKGRHYRGTRFLELFLKIIGRETYISLDPETLTIRKEFCPDGQDDQIDLYITDGEKTIVIENKLNALDQRGQVKRYLKAVGADGSNEYRDTLFIYLTKGRTAPSRRALAYKPDKHTKIKDPQPLQVFDGSVLGTSKNAPWALYQNLSYRSESGPIHKWLDACEHEIKDLDEAENIVWAIRDYRDVVKRATGEYVSKVKSLKEHFEDNGWAGSAYHQNAIEFAQELNAAHIKWLHEAMTSKLEALFEQELKANKLTRIEKRNAESLADYLAPDARREPDRLIYNRAGNFFVDPRRNKLRGSFYLVNHGVFKDRAVLMLFYGPKNLHVGYLLSTKEIEKPDWLRSEPAISSLKRSCEKTFSNAHTQSVPIATAGIRSLANFDRSRGAEEKTYPEREILQKLARAFVPNTES